MSNIPDAIGTLYTVQQSYEGMSLPQITQQQFYLRMAGKGALRGTKDSAGSGNGKARVIDTGMAAVNTAHYATDEMVGLGMLHHIKGLFRGVVPQQMAPEFTAAVAAVGAETLALTGLAAILGLINLGVRKSKRAPVREVSRYDQGVATVTLGVPFAAQTGKLPNARAVVVNSATAFAGSHVVLGGSVIGASEIVSPNVAYLVGGAYLLKSLVEWGYDQQASAFGLEKPPKYEPRHRTGTVRSADVQPAIDAIATVTDISSAPSYTEPGIIGIAQ